MSLYKRGLEKAGSSAVAQKRTPLVKSSSFFKTDIDKFYHLVEISPSGVSLDKVLEILDVSAVAVDDWAKILEKQGLLEIVYTPAGSTVYRLKGSMKETQGYSFSFQQLKNISLPPRRIIFIVLLILLLVGISFVVYFYSDTLFVSDDSSLVENSSDVSVALESSFFVQEFSSFSQREMFI